MSELFLTSQDGLKIFYCPGCKCSHAIDPKKWTFNEETNTISPSVLVKHVNNHNEWEVDEDGNYVFENGKVKGSKMITCHIFVKNGQIQYLNDCTHELAGQTVDMVKF